jgi:hypothetical protein
MKLLYTHIKVYSAVNSNGDTLYTLGSPTAGILISIINEQGEPTNDELLGYRIIYRKYKNCEFTLDNSEVNLDLKGIGYITPDNKIIFKSNDFIPPYIIDLTGKSVYNYDPKTTKFKFDKSNRTSIKIKNS